MMLHRSSGEQKVTLEHVTVRDGRKAVFGLGNVSQGAMARRSSPQ
jgi:hypothetical protein